MSGVNTILLVVILVAIVGGGMWWYKSYGPGAMMEEKDSMEGGLEINLGGSASE